MAYTYLNVSQKDGAALAYTYLNVSQQDGAALLSHSPRQSKGRGGTVVSLSTSVKGTGRGGMGGDTYVYARGAGNMHYLVWLSSSSGDA